MISKHLFSDLMKEDLKRRIWPAALSILGCFFAMPVYCLLMTGIWFERLGSGLTTLEDIRLSFYTNVLGFGNIPVLLLIIALALVNGLQGMGYLLSRVQSDLYGSIPVKRTVLFGAGYLNGILLFAAPYSIMHITCVLIGASRGILTENSLAFGFINLLVQVLAYTAIYTVVVLSAILTGHIVVAMAGTLVLLGIGPFGILMDYAYKTTFFLTCSDEQASEHWTTLFSSPVATLIGLSAEVLELNGSGYLSRKFWILTAVMLAATLLLALACFLLIRIRPAEAAGNAMAFSPTRPVIKAAVMVPAAMAFGIFFYYIGRSSRGWLVFGIVMGILLCQALAEVIFEFDLKAAVKHPKSFGVGVVLSCFVIGIYVFDLLGYDRYIPDPGSVSYAALSGYGLQDGITYLEEEPGSYGYMDNTAYRLEHMRLTCIGDVNTLAGAGVEFARARRRGELMSGDEDRSYASLTICWTKKNGRKVCRQYSGIDLCDAEIFDAYDRIYQTREYKDGVYPCLSLTPDRMDLAVVQTSLEERPLVLSDREKQELLKVYNGELLKQDARGIRDSFPCARIRTECYWKPGENKNRGFDPEGDGSYTTGDLFVFPEFEQTAAFLRDHGVDVAQKADPQRVSRIQVNWFEGEEWQTAEYRAPEDSDKISEILAHSIPQEFYGMNSALQPMNGGGNYNIDVEYGNPGGADNDWTWMSGYQSYAFLPGEVPDFVGDEIK
ncbi:MAG: DUF6449 domain-containing protein [Lachnospiraceae bacterium]|nr:DUF6449 domain-containing protein [Lachnospiraceae bacterium]